MSKSYRCLLIQLTNQSQFAFLQFITWLASIDIGNGRIAGAKYGRLITGWQKSASEIVQSARRYESTVQHHEVREILTFGAESITEPRTH